MNDDLLAAYLLAHAVHEAARARVKAAIDESNAAAREIHAAWPVFIAAERALLDSLVEAQS